MRGLLLLVPLLCAAPLPAQVDAAVRTEIVPRVVAPGEGERRVLPDGRHMLLKVGPASTGAAYLFLGAEDLPPGTGIPRHRHELDEEILIVQRGVLTVELNDTAHAAPAGSVVYLPPRAWISVRNEGSETATLMFVFPRGSVERCFQFIGRGEGETRREQTAEEQAEEARACQMTYETHRH
jgi:quercetin dioxygenase-like cupin family protein